MSFKKNLNEFLTNCLQLTPEQAKCYPVKIHNQAGLKVKKCFSNCKLMQKTMAGSEIVPCWIILSHKEIVCDCIAVLGAQNQTKLPQPGPRDFEAEFHFVLRGPSGLVDVTPDMNKKKMFRRIVLEPRLTFEEFQNFHLRMPENVANPEWIEKCPVAEPLPDFFNLLKTVELLRNLKQ